MRQILPRLFTLTAILLLLLPATIAAQEVEWMSWEEALARSESDAEPKKIFVDVYTDWCGWCKRMDATTFVDPTIVSLMDEHFYAVKLNATTARSKSVNFFIILRF